MKKNPIDKNSDGQIQFENISYLIELFPSPLPNLLDGEATYETSDDLIMSSGHFGFDELYLSTTAEVNAVVNNKNVKFKTTDFISWQLMRMDAHTLYYLANKTEADVESLFDIDKELESDPDFDLETWLNPYGATVIEIQKGVALFERLKSDLPNEFCKLLIEAILDESTGVLSWLETAITDNVNEVKEKYLEWTVPLMIVSRGQFMPYIDNSESDHLLRDQYRLFEMHVRNYDEGEI